MGYALQNYEKQLNVLHINLTYFKSMFDKKKVSSNYFVQDR